MLAGFLHKRLLVQPAFKGTSVCAVKGLEVTVSGKNPPEFGSTAEPWCCQRTGGPRGVPSLEGVVSEGGVRCLPTSEVSRPVCRQQWRPHGPQSAGQLGPVCTQVVIVIYLSVVGALLMYMAFLMLVDPLIRKPDAYTERLRSEEESEVWALPAPWSPSGGRGPRPSGLPCAAVPETGVREEP